MLATQKQPIMTTTDNGALSFASMQSTDEQKKTDLGFESGPLLELDQALGRLDASVPKDQANVRGRGRGKGRGRGGGHHGMGKIRAGIDEKFVQTKLAQAWQAHPDYTMKIIFKTRDCRGGKGEREMFRFCLKWLYEHHKKDIEALMEYIPFYGRWDDVLAIPGGAQHMGEQLKLDLAELKSNPTALSLSTSENGTKKSFTRTTNTSSVSSSTTNKQENQEPPTQAMDTSEDATTENKEESSQQDNPKNRKRKGISLAAKWAPVEGRKRHKQHPNSIQEICSVLGIKGSDTEQLMRYRKDCLGKLKPYLNLVETKMCDGLWNKINFSHVPSRAMKKFNKAFAKHDADRFKDWLDRLVKGDKSVKVNAKQLFVHEIVSQYLNSNHNEANPLLEAQWDVLLKEVSDMGTLKDSIVLSDVSSSMDGEPMQVSIALGILISAVTQPPFQNQVISFHETPFFHQVTGETLHEKVAGMKSMSWGGSTNLQAVFDLIVKEAKHHNVSKENMPKRLFILSDMQFDEACSANNRTNHQSMMDTFTNEGYDPPQIVYWNLRSNNRDGYPVQSDTLNAVMLSGFSTSALKELVAGGLPDTTPPSPWDVLKLSLDNIRYAPIVSLPPGTE